MNMSYCRFENTLGDLADCCWALEEFKRISPNEWVKAQSLRETCERYIKSFDEYVENLPNMEDEDEDDI